MSKDLALADVKQEIAVTRRVLDRLPEDGFDWRPHAKSMSLGELATHLADLIGWQRLVLERDEVDLAVDAGRQEPHTVRAALLADFDEQRAELEAALDAVEADALGKEWVLRYGERVIMTVPRMIAYRSFGVSHMVHHRAQLGVYLRLLGIPVPSVYGPTADEPAA